MDSENQEFRLPYQQEILNLVTIGKIGWREHTVLTYLVERMNKKTKSCWPSQKKIAHDLQCSTRTIIRSIKRLEETGVLDIKKLNEKKGNLNRYYLTIAGECDKGDNSVTTVVTNLSQSIVTNLSSKNLPKENLPNRKENEEANTKNPCSLEKNSSRNFSQSKGFCCKENGKNEKVSRRRPPLLDQIRDICQVPALNPDVFKKFNHEKKERIVNLLIESKGPNSIYQKVNEYADSLLARREESLGSGSVVFPEAWKNVSIFNIFYSETKGTSQFKQFKKWAKGESMAVIEEKIDDGNSVHASGIKKKINKSTLTADNILPIIKSACAEYGVGSAELGFTKKEKGCVRNFCQYCKESDYDPKWVLIEAIKNWHTIFNSNLTRNGYPVTISKSFSFMELFNLRRVIIPFLIVELPERQKRISALKIHYI